jgi:hypothetical protein
MSECVGGMYESEVCHPLSTICLWVSFSSLWMCVVGLISHQTSWNLVSLNSLQRSTTFSLRSAAVEPSLWLKKRTGEPVRSLVSPWHRQQRSRHNTHAQLQPGRTAPAAAGGGFLLPSPSQDVGGEVSAFFSDKLSFAVRGTHP